MTSEIYKTWDIGNNEYHSILNVFFFLTIPLCFPFLSFLGLSSEFKLNEYHSALFS